MISTKAAHRYAEAIFPLAKEKNQLDEVMQDFNLLCQLIDSAADFRILIASPVISRSNKKTIFIEIFKNKTSQLTFNFLILLVEKGRENLIPTICDRFKILYNAEKSLLPVTITTASELTAEIKQNVILKIENISHKKVLPEYKLDKSVIGGIVIRIEDWVYDASLLRKLEQVRQQLQV